MRNIKSTKNMVSFFLISNIVISFISPITYARTVSEIQKEIDAKKEELVSVETNIGDLESQLETQREELENVKGKRGQLYAQIEINKKEEQVIVAKLNDLRQTHELSELEQEQRILLQDGMISDSYVNWKQSNMIKELLSSESESILKVATYQAALTGDEQKNIETLEEEIKLIQQELEKSEKEKKQFEARLAELNAQAQAINSEIQELDNKIAANQNDVANYRTQIDEIQVAIEGLAEEQKEIQELEGRFLGKADNGGTKDLEAGDLYFQGVGRVSKQGHGVGFSQFGALGAALAGWDAEKIVEFYYPGAKVVKYKEISNINVEGYGSMSVEKYASGIGEVPDTSCEELEIEFDSKNIWSCWPEEAIKAQVIASRTFGIYRMKGSGSICTDHRCQVYKGGNGKEWAAEETKNLVLIYEGEPIGASFSSDNSNGWGTANNDTVWSDKEGNGTPRPYLRSVNDASFTLRTKYTNWGWRTNGYSMDDINEMIDWNIKSSKASDSNRAFLQSIKSEIGEIESLSFERDPSGRVNKIKLKGENGSRYIAGWLFKSIWNIWVGNEMPTGEEDYIFSLTYYLREK